MSARNLRQCPHQELDARRGRGRPHAVHPSGGEKMAIFDAAMKYAETRTLVILAGQEWHG
jgi:aconitase A